MAPIHAPLTVDGANVEFFVDIRASKTIILKSVFDLIDKSMQLKQTSIRLRTYIQQVIPLAGESKVKVTHYNRSSNLTVLISRDEGLNLLGRD